MDGLAQESVGVRTAIIPIDRVARDALGPPRHEPLWDVDVIVAFCGHVLYRGSPFEFVPSELPAFESALQCLEQHNRK